MMSKHRLHLQKEASSTCLAVPELTSGHGGRNFAYQMSTDLDETHHAFTRDQYLVNGMAGILIFDFILKKSNFL